MHVEVIQTVILILHLRHRSIQKYWDDSAKMVLLFGRIWKTARWFYTGQETLKERVSEGVSAYKHDIYLTAQETFYTISKSMLKNEWTCQQYRIQVKNLNICLEKNSLPLSFSVWSLLCPYKASYQSPSWVDSTYSQYSIND